MSLNPHRALHEFHLRACFHELIKRERLSEYENITYKFVDWFSLLSVEVQFKAFDKIAQWIKKIRQNPVNTQQQNPILNQLHQYEEMRKWWALGKGGRLQRSWQVSGDFCY